MEILEFGNKEKDKIILIHGFETPYQIWEKYIEHYKNNYHIIVPILQGHNPNMKEDFNSFEESAKDIEDYIISRYGNNVFAIYGMSMGGVLTSQIWQNKKLYIDKVILESSPLISYNKLMTLMMTKQYLMLTHKTQARDKRVITQAVNSIIPKDKLDVFLAMMDNMSDTTITNYIRQIGRYKLPSNIDTPNTEVYYYYGTKINELLAKKTAEYIRRNYPNSKIKCFQGKGHCEDSLLNPSVMITELDNVLGIRKTNNIQTNYSQPQNRIKSDESQEINEIGTRIEQDEIER
ncbi:MAG TPA: hypothetical protein IAD08_00330 [Candidatus Scatovivens faecipullorum]|nr:hypothetical protein [Candidatus Scatovivens faecipullorum]